jgi:hypothetical protein
MGENAEGGPTADEAGPGSSPTQGPTRPLGVTILGAIFALVGIIGALEAVNSVASDASVYQYLGSLNSSTIDGFNSTVLSYYNFLKVGVPVEIGYFVLAAVISVLAVAVALLLWTGRRWGRVLAPWVYVLSAANVAWYIAYFIRAPSGLFPPSSVASNALLVAAGVIWSVFVYSYLRRPAPAKFLAR